MEDHIKKYQSLAGQVRLYAMDTIINSADRVVYHDVGYAKRLIDNIQTICQAKEIPDFNDKWSEIAAWLYTSMFSDVELKEGEGGEDGFTQAYAELLEQKHVPFLQKAGASSEAIEYIVDLLRFPNPNEKIEPKPSQGLFNDAIMMDFIDAGGKDRLRTFYKETLLVDFGLGRGEFYDIVIKYLIHYEPYTGYAKENIQPQTLKLISTLEKEKKNLRKREEIVIKKELAVSDEELKQLRKNLKSAEGKDIRGIQTMFRTTSRNHYTLNQMVDRKANIMITVNSIILSVAIGGAFTRNELTDITVMVPILILTIASVFSIVTAISAIRPDKTHGKFTVEDIRNKEGNLLFYGNFHNMPYRDYEWGMLEKLNDSNFLYTSMIKDLYFLGKTLHRKYRYIRTSLNVFLIGIVSAFIVSLLMNFMAMSNS